jgi:hypothetical protein
VKKKYGPLPLYLWVILVGGGGYLLYRYYKSRQAAEPEPLGEGLYPTRGLEAPPEGGSVPSGGVAQLGELLKELGALGFVPAGSEEAKGEPQFAPPSKLESLLEEGFGAYLEGLMHPAAVGAPAKVKKPGPKSAAGQKQKHPGHDHHPGHTQTPSHSAAKHPKQRMAVGNHQPASGPGAQKGPAPKPAPVAGAGGGMAQIGGAGGASGGVIHPLAYSSGIGGGHPKPGAPAGYHTYQGANGQWWFAPN